MTPKEYLKQIEVLENQVKHLCFELEAAENTIAQIRAIRYDSVKVQNGTRPHEASFEKEIDHVIELRNKLVAKIAETNEKRHEIISVLNEVPNVIYSSLLFKLFVEHKTLEDCAKELGFSYDYTIELQRKALKAVKVPRSSGSQSGGGNYSTLASARGAEICESSC